MGNYLNIGKQDLANDAVIGEDSHIEVGELVMRPGSSIGPGARIFADRLYVGEGTSIGRNFSIPPQRRGLGRSVSLGDSCSLGNSCEISAYDFSMGDYGIVQSQVVFQGYKPMAIGHNFWVGMGALLNSTGGLTIGNNVGIGARAEIYSHGYHGELLEGCAINSVAPVNIGNDVWLTGSVYVSPGIDIGDSSIVLFQSNVTKHIPPGVLARGNPAKVVDGFVTYSHPTMPEKVKLMSGFLGEFYSELTRLGYETRVSQGESGKVDILNGKDYGFRVLLAEGQQEVARDLDNSPSLDTLLITGDLLRHDLDEITTHFSLSDKRYTKRRTPAEIMFMQHMVPLKARFIPG